MLVNVSLVVLFGVAVAFMVRARAVGLGGAVLCTLFGIYLARTGAAGPITGAVTSLIHWLNAVAK